MITHITIILLALWNGFVIRWKQHKLGNEQQKEDSDIWHSIGFWTRIGLWIIVFVSTFSWGMYIIDPIGMFFEEWWARGLNTMLAIGESYWIYNLIINKINRWKWNYQKELTTQMYKVSLIVYSILLITLMILSVVYGLKE